MTVPIANAGRMGNYCRKGTKTKVLMVYASD